MAKRQKKKASDHRSRSCTVGLFRSLGFWSLAPPMIVDGGCLYDMTCIRNSKHRIEAIAGCHCNYWQAARPGGGSLASDASGCRFLGFWSYGPQKICRRWILLAPLVTLRNNKIDIIRSCSSRNNIKTPKPMPCLIIMIVHYFISMPINTVIHMNDRVNFMNDRGKWATLFHKHAHITVIHKKLARASGSL